MEPQVQLDESTHLVNHVVGKAQRSQPLTSLLSANDFVMMKTHAATGLKFAGTRFANVMQ